VTQAGCGLGLKYGSWGCHVSSGKEMVWPYLVHLSYNMWADRLAPEWGLEHVSARPFLRFDQALWHDIRQAMVKAGLNMVVLDLGDGVAYESHPELAVEGAWSTAQLRTELGQLRDLGLEPIPKLDFSTSHDVWLGPYARCVSTELYYQVCRDLIEEVVGLFDRPRFFHLGMDEETARHQRHYAYAVIRQHELWWHDLQFLVDQVEAANVRPWVWSDYVWEHPDAFFANMPHSVVQSNWYYGPEFGPDVERCKAYLDLEAHGYDQMPTGSNWIVPENLPRTVAFCREHVAPSRLLGFLQTVWKPTLESCRAEHMQALDAMARAIADW
jgi:hypothetical protein